MTEQEKVAKGLKAAMVKIDRLQKYAYKRAFKNPDDPEAHQLVNECTRIFGTMSNPSK